MRIRSLNLTELNALVFRNQKQNKTFSKTTTYWPNQKKNLKNAHILDVLVKIRNGVKHDLSKLCQSLIGTKVDI